MPLLPLTGPRYTYDGRNSSPPLSSIRAGNTFPGDFLTSSWERFINSRALLRYQTLRSFPRHGLHCPVSLSWQLSSLWSGDSVISHYFPCARRQRDASPSEQNSLVSRFKCLHNVHHWKSFISDPLKIFSLNGDVWSVTSHHFPLPSLCHFLLAFVTLVFPFHSFSRPGGKRTILLSLISRQFVPSSCIGGV